MTRKPIPANIPRVNGKSAAPSINRRQLLAASSAATLLAMMPGFSSAAMPSADLSWIARFLTGKTDLSAAYLARALAALESENQGYGTSLAQLAQSIRAAGLADVDAFRASPLAQQPGAMKTALTLISALYLGRTGQGNEGQLISFEQALMFRPTADALVIPSYSTAAADYWIAPPSGAAP